MIDNIEVIKEWKYHPVTQEVFAELRERIAGLKDEITAKVLDADPRQLAYMAGAVQALQDVLDTEY